MADGWRAAEGDLAALMQREWLVSNGIGGYAASTVPALNTRKYHGLLVAAMAPPYRPMVLLSRLEETAICDERRAELACNEYPDIVHPTGYTLLRAFDHEPFPRWAYQADGWTLEKQLRLIRGENTVVISWSLLGNCSPLDLELRPLFALRPVHDLTFQSSIPLLTESRGRNLYRVAPTIRTPEVFFAHAGTFVPAPVWYLNTIYRREQERGYAGLEDLWCPGVVRLRLTPGESVHFVCSTEPIDLAQAVARAEQQYSSADGPSLPSSSDASSPIGFAVTAGAARSVVYAPDGGPTVEPSLSSDRYLRALRNAAEQFLVSASAGASRDSQRWVMGGYPWQDLSVRSALAGFTGLFCSSGHYDDGRLLLTGLIPLLRNGLLPSAWPDAASELRYNAADLSLWWINAAYAYLRYTRDEPTVRRVLLDAMLRILDSFQRGSDLHVTIDADGLLSSHEPGSATTWMDAKVGDWVITPRGGRAVEVNALWYNALSIAAELTGRFGMSDHHASLADRARQTQAGFNRRFWNDRSGCCFDVVTNHGPDPSIRPNQLLAVSLPFAVLDPARQQRVLDVVRSELLTPMGVRSLSPRDPAYVGRYGGGVVARDRAYHNGSAWPWLLGHLSSATLKVRGRDRAARAEALSLLRPVLHHLAMQGLGNLCELFDGDLPQQAGGAIASAVATAEVLRAYCEDVLDLGPGDAGSSGLVIRRLGTSDTDSPRVSNPS